MLLMLKTVHTFWVNTFSVYIIISELLDLIIILDEFYMLTKFNLYVRFYPSMYCYNEKCHISIAMVLLYL